VRRTAHFVLDREQQLAGVEVDDILEAVLILVVFDRDEIARLQLLVGAGEIRDVHLHVMAVELRLRTVGLAKLHVLVLAHLDAGERAIAVLHLRRRSHDGRIEIRNAPGGADRHVELHIRYPERNTPEARRVRLMAAHAIAPRTDRLDVIIVLGKAEFRAVEFRAHLGQAIQQCIAARDHQSGMAAHHLRRSGRQMKLAAPGIDPHVGVGDHQVRIARQPEPDRVEQLRQPLVRHLHVDVLEVDGVAEVLGGAVEVRLHGRCPGRVFLGRTIAPSRPADHPPNTSRWRAAAPAARDTLDSRRAVSGNCRCIIRAKSAANPLNVEPTSGACTGS
jgi:hypothetical protein